MVTPEIAAESALAALLDEMEHLAGRFSAQEDLRQEITPRRVADAIAADLAFDRALSEAIRRRHEDE